MKLTAPLIATLLTTTTFLSGQNARADAGTVVEICNASGVCTTVAPEVGVALTIISLLSDELQKDHPFGESNEIVRALNELTKFVNGGMGPHNDLRKFIEDVGIDHILQQLGIKLFS